MFDLTSLSETPTAYNVYEYKRRLLLLQGEHPASYSSNTAQLPNYKRSTRLLRDCSIDLFIIDHLSSTG